MLSIDRLTRLSEDGTKILDEVSLELGKSETLGLVGRSGSGKSSLLRCIAWLDSIQSGDVRIDGVSVSSVCIPGYRRRVVYLPQRPALIEGTVEQNLSLPFNFDSSLQALDRDAAIGWLEPFDAAAPSLDQPAHQLSGGQRQCVALVRALLVNPDILLLDEPTTAMDEKSMSQFEQVLRTWKDESPQRSWIWTSHDKAQVARMTQRSARMEAGRINHVTTDTSEER